MDLDWTNNLALGKPASQSSTVLDRFAREAVDGDREVAMVNSCTQTAFQKKPWWQIDLEAIYQVKKVVVTNSVVQCGTLTILIRQDNTAVFNL